ncbi:MAG: ABC transporter ATP-binding protein [Candidatus Glassbacteria bacterium]
MTAQVDKLLGVDNFSLSLDIDRKSVRVIDGISFDVENGEIVGMAGESGSGKSITSQSILRLLPCPPWKLDGGAIYFKGRDLYSLSKEEMRGIRGREIAVVLQEPMTSLNPFYTIGQQVEEVLTAHLGTGRKESRNRAIEALAEVGIPGPSERAGQYPHQLSGGLRQRVMIAVALALKPDLLLADEPTTALDLTIQAQILDLIRKLSEERAMAVLFITHDLAVLKGIADRTIVMYSGVLVEAGPTGSLFEEPLHPYTKALIEVIPRPKERKKKLGTIPGSIPKPDARPGGCPFHPRCGYAIDRCREDHPVAKVIDGARMVRCWLY